MSKKMSENVWPGSFWVRIWASERLLWKCWYTLGFHYMLEILVWLLTNDFASWRSRFIEDLHQSWFYGAVLGEVWFFKVWQNYCLCAHIFVLLFKVVVAKFFVKLANRHAERRFQYRVEKILVGWNCVMAGSSESRAE
jgi:hypothetical protein